MGEYCHEVKEVALEGFKCLNATSKVQYEVFNVTTSNRHFSEELLGYKIFAECELF